ncbi:MAG: VCBS repeat-containing protein [Acidobacteria bacterium]|nr:VCBS repeat-containing protein [Acidobacteriota bacterium]
MRKFALMVLSPFLLSGIGLDAADCGDVILIPSEIYERQQNNWSIATGDFNGDGAIDLAIPDANYPRGSLKILLGDGRGRFALLTDYTVPSHTGLVRAGDLDGDGHLDLIIRAYYASEIFWGVGDGAFAGPDTPPELVTPLHISDLNHDGIADIVGGMGDWLAVQLGGGRTLTTPVLLLTSSYGFFPTVGDVNGDGNLDIIAGQSFSTDLLTGNGDGTFNEPLHLDDGGHSSFLADLNGDGADDLIMVGFGPATSTALSRGDGTFDPPVAVEIGITGDNIRFTQGDFDGDGKIDLIASTTSKSYLMALTGKGDGTFQPPRSIPLNSPVYEAHVEDLDSNGTPDLLTANNFGGAQPIFNGCGIVFGDANRDDVLDVADIFYLINFLFDDGSFAPWFADANGDRTVTPADIFYLVNYLWAEGPPPVE